MNRIARRYPVPLATALLLAAPALFLTLFLAYPLQGILRESFTQPGTGAGGLKDVDRGQLLPESDSGLRRWQAAVSTLLTIIVAFPCART